MQITRILSLALLCVQAIVGSASAECAWVLWSETLTVRQSPIAQVDKEWSPASAWPDQMSCGRARRDWLDGFRALGDATMTVQGDTRILTMSNGDQILTARTCFPDTIDPRGPRGR